MILAIRISGMVKVPTDMAETLDRMRLRKKYVATLFKDTPENRKLLIKVRNYIAYGIVSDETLEKIIDARGQWVAKEGDAKKAVSQIKTKSMEEAGLKPFFRLHPPRKGIDSKYHVGIGKGVLGDHKNEIAKLVERML